MQQILDSARNQYRAFFKRMAFEGHAWHFYRTLGTDQFLLMRDDAKFDRPECHALAVRNVHTMGEARALAAIQTIIRG